MAVLLEDRVFDLEQLMAQLLQTVAQTSREMQVFKDEMRDFKDEMSDFKDEMSDFKDEMSDFKDEMRDFKNESRKRWGELSHKLGTMAEDLVAPSIPKIMQNALGCPINSVSSAVRVKRRNEQGQLREFDVVSTCENYLCINETKSKLSPEAIKIFVETTLPTVRDFFPEYAHKQVIGIMASLYVDQSLVRYAEKQGLLILGFGQDLMDILNTPNFMPKAW